MSLPSMLSDFEFPEIYVIFLNKISFVNVDFMSIIGAQCVIDVDFRFSVLVTLCIPLFVFLLTLFLYLRDLFKIDSRTKKMSLERKQKLIGTLFDMSDEDLSGVIDEEEFVHIVEFIAPRKVARLIIKMPKSEVQQVMLSAGAKMPRTSKDSIYLTRDSFVKSVCAAATEETSNHKNKRGDIMTVAQCIPLNRALKFTQKQSSQSTHLSGMVQFFLMIHAPIAAKSFHVSFWFLYQKTQKNQGLTIMYIFYILTFFFLLFFFLLLLFCSSVFRLPHIRIQ